MYFSEDSIHTEIIKRDFQGATAEELKDLYIQRNILGCDPDTFIYRLTRTDYFIEDLATSKITLSNISADVFDDYLENPLSGKYFKDGDDSFTLGFLENYYALCWTNDPTDSAWRWERFLKQKPGVRIKVCLRKFMHRLMSTEDPFFMLNYFAAKINYVDFETIENLGSDNDYSKFLDTLGLNALPLVTTLTDHLEDEEEIRIIYSHSPSNNEFTARKVIIRDRLCKIPFDWTGVIEEVLIASHLSDSEYSNIEEKLRCLGINAIIKRSKPEH
ncbi:Uncharacterised protein [Pseudomonas luteola]|uniref:DUF2971 domain-containing protein n=1 Tax=Pseudomonas luteola TaxID=47886 RepID=A0A2X2BWD5_PSELU|nr:hypothetical protein [Pseudomonas luteola]SPY99997.1 Uncharacterised protein [Pseudomonas luteola]